MGADRQQLEEILGRLSGIPEAVRQTLTDHLWSTIPIYINEANYAAALASGAALSVGPQTGDYERITGILAVVPSGATGLLELGPVKIPLAAGLFNPPAMNLVLATSDVRRLTISGGTGATALWLSGEALPSFGILPR